MVTSAPARMIPGRKAMPLVNWRGNYIQFARDPVSYLFHLCKDYGTLAGFIATPDHQKATLITCDPQYNQQLMTNHTLFHARTISLDAGKDTSLGRLGVGVPVINGDQHRQQRRLIMPAFHKKQLETYLEDMVSITDEAVTTWKSGETRDLAKDIQKITLQITVKTLFGLDNSLTESISHMLQQWLQLNISAAFVPMDWPGLPMRRLRVLSENLEQTILSIIASRRADPGEARDVLSTFIQSKDEDGAILSDAEIVGNMNLLFVAGTETSSNTLAWTLLLLTQHPQILSDVVDELEGVLGGAVPTVETLGKLPLLDRVLKEALRILSPVTYNTRQSTDDFEMGPYHMLKGSMVLYSPFLTHRLSSLYTHPGRFMPDRWLTSEVGPYEYLPFGTGARMCIGSNFALMQMKVILAIMLQRFRVSLIPNARIDRKEIVTLMPKQGMPMTIHRQDHQFSQPSVQGNILEMVDIPGLPSHPSVWAL